MRWVLLALNVLLCRVLSGQIPSSYTSMRDGVKDHNHIGTMPNPTQGVWEGGGDKGQGPSREKFSSISLDVVLFFRINSVNFTWNLMYSFMNVT
jgi:hypothetical protein